MKMRANSRNLKLVKLTRTINLIMMVALVKGSQKVRRTTVIVPTLLYRMSLDALFVFDGHLDLGAVRPFRL